MLVAISTIIIAGIYAAYRIGPATPDPVGVALQPIGAPERDAPTTTSAAPVAGESKLVEPERIAEIRAPIATINRAVPNATPLAVESKPVEPERTAAIRAPVPTINPAVPNAKPLAVESKPVEVKRAAALRAPIATTNPAAPKRTTAPQRPLPAARPPLAASPSVKHSLAARRDARAAKLRTVPQPPWQAMHVSLTRCGGELIASIVCELRVRQPFCEGHWAEAPECASGITNDHGQ